jgi:hypothetical protein
MPKFLVQEVHGTTMGGVESVSASFVVSVPDSPFDMTRKARDAFARAEIEHARLNDHLGFSFGKDELEPEAFDSEGEPASWVAADGSMIAYEVRLLPETELEV